MQFDLAPQSPQPSHTAALMKMRFGGSAELAALALAAPLGRAHLVVQEHRDAMEFAQLALRSLELLPVVHRDAGRQRSCAGTSPARR